jgi:hypothetical protein
MRKQKSDELIIGLNDHPELATVNVPISIGGGTPRPRPSFALFDLVRNKKLETGAERD